MGRIAVCDSGHRAADRVFGVGDTQDTNRLTGDTVQVQGNRAPNVRVPSHWGKLSHNKG